MALGALLRKPHAHRNDAAVVSFDRVTVRYNGSPPALVEVTFDLQPGERIAIVGPNGAGKSTLLKVVAGILAPSSGRRTSTATVRAATSASATSRSAPRSTGVSPSACRRRNDGRVAKIGLLRQARRSDWSACARASSRSGMAAFAKRQIGELSGGQQQRVFIARALAQEAELLLMDEPLTGLDVPSQEAIFAILDLVARRA
jgi:manganese/iron transport system ATP-binding protein